MMRFKALVVFVLPGSLAFGQEVAKPSDLVSMPQSAEAAEFEKYGRSFQWKVSSKQIIINWEVSGSVISKQTSWTL